MCEEKRKEAEGIMVEYQLCLEIISSHNVSYRPQGWCLCNNPMVTLTTNYMHAYHTSEFLGAQQFNEPWNNPRVHYSLNPVSVSISEVGEGPASITNHILVFMADEVGKSWEKLWDTEGEHQC